MKPNNKDNDFKNACDLLSVYSEGSARLKEMQGEMDSMFLSLVDDKKTEYADLQKTVTEAETALEVIARRHPEWFAEKRSVKTPFGTMKFFRATSLEIKNPDLTIVLLRDIIRNSADPAYAASIYLRQVEEPNVEALEKLDDATLKDLKIKRVTKDSFSVAPASVDLGKAVKEAVAKEVQG